MTRQRPQNARRLAKKAGARAMRRIAKPTPNVRTYGHSQSDAFDGRAEVATMGSFPTEVASSGGLPTVEAPAFKDEENASAPYITQNPNPDKRFNHWSKGEVQEAQDKKIPQPARGMPLPTMKVGGCVRRGH